MSQTDYKDYIYKLKSFYSDTGYSPSAAVITYGCQQNTADSEILKGILCEIGFNLTDNVELADLAVFNTCAVREHAELKVYGNIGALKPIKKLRPNMKIAVCGCMMQQQSVQNEIKRKFSHIDMVFGPSLIPKFPEILYESVINDKKVFDISESPEIVENLPVKRSDNNKAWVTVMYGCNNFCTYCIVPYLRGRERSRTPDAVEAEVRSLVKSGFKDIILLGQNVNSYGKDSESKIDFSDLLLRLDAIEGDFWIRFMTSHPKDCTEKLIDTMANSRHICKQLHLPFQSGNDRVLKAMNRHYIRDKYISLIEYARKRIPDIALTSDVIVGFPGETADEFTDTVELIKEIGFDNLFTFIYSRRTGTPAAVMDNQISDEEKSRRFKLLLDAQHPISKIKNDAFYHKTVRVFVEGESKTDGSVLAGRTEGGKTVDFIGDKSLIGCFADVYITECKTWNLLGELINKGE